MRNCTWSGPVPSQWPVYRGFDVVSLGWVIFSADLSFSLQGVPVPPGPVFLRTQNSPGPCPVSRTIDSEDFP